MDYKIELISDNKEDLSTFLRDKIREFNNQQSKHHKDIRQEGEVEKIHLVVSNENEAWIGGLSAEVYWNWLEINYFWVDEHYRGRGFGEQLLNQAENLAKEKGAERALLTTFKFQARTFYEARGYRVVGEVKDYPPGSSYYTMVKILN